MSPTETVVPPTHGKRTLDILVAIDSDAVLLLRDRPGDFENPMRIAGGYGFMIVTASGGVDNQGTEEVACVARAGDTVRVFLSSGSNNFEQIVALADIRYVGDDEILKDFTSQVEERLGIAPESPANVLPARLSLQQFRFSQGVVGGEGTGGYDLVFELYDRDEGNQPDLIGYYRWAMQLTVTLG